MLPLPEDFDVSVFLGRRVELVCFSANTLTIHFDRDIAITSEATLIHERVAEGRTERTEQVVPAERSGLMQLIGPAVVAAHVAGSADLIFEFEDGQILRVVEHPMPYESYHIRLGDRELHV